MNRIVWLASYPKSGNTWFRVFLTNFLHDGPEPADINNLHGGPIASSRAMFDEAVGYDSGELTPDEVDRLRPEVYAHLSRKAEDTLYCKVHDAYTYLPDGRPLFPPEATAGVIYFVRNPLDVAVSFAHHSGHADYNRVIRSMGNHEAVFCDKRDSEPHQLRQRVLTWSEHYRSWTTAPGLRTLVLRYEDMKEDPIRFFGEAVRFLGLPDDAERLAKAVRFSDFDELRKQEDTAGFVEKLHHGQTFFRKGRPGAWRESLSEDQAAIILADHRALMLALGYLDAQGNPVY